MENKKRDTSGNIVDTHTCYITTGCSADYPGLRAQKLGYVVGCIGCPTCGTTVSGAIPRVCSLCETELTYKTDLENKMDKKAQKTLNKVEHLKTLGVSAGTDYSYDEPTADILETFDNTAVGRPYVIELLLPEWTGMCPKTGQPDMANMVIRYIPNLKCVESKSLKLYVVAYRNYGCFMESTTNKFIDDFIAACDPNWIQVTGKFAARGGITLNVYAEHTKDGFELPRGV